MFSDASVALICAIVLTVLVALLARASSREQARARSKMQLVAFAAIDAEHVREIDAREIIAVNAMNDVQWELALARAARDAALDAQADIEDEVYALREDADNLRHALTNARTQTDIVRKYWMRQTHIARAALATSIDAEYAASIERDALAIELSQVMAERRASDAERAILWASSYGASYCVGCHERDDACTCNDVARGWWTRGVRESVGYAADDAEVARMASAMRAMHVAEAEAHLEDAVRDLSDDEFDTLPLDATRAVRLA